MIMKTNKVKTWKNDVKVGELGIERDKDLEFYAPIRHNNKFISYHIVIERHGVKYYIWARAFGNSLPSIYCGITKNYTYNDFKKDMIEMDF